jgi:hypothetical protein
MAKPPTGMEEDKAPFERTDEPEKLAPRPAAAPADVEDVAARIIKRFPRILAKLAE